MIVRSGLLVCIAAGLLGPCEAPNTATDAPAGDDGLHAAKPKSTAEPEELPNPETLDCEPPLACSMAGLRCPSSTLPRVQDQLDDAGWTKLQTLAAKQVVAVQLGPSTATIVESCEVPGHYLEVVAAPESPGRAWASDRLVYTPDEPRGCAGATHFIAAFAVRNGQPSGVAIALPLPCPNSGTGAPDYCIGAGLDDEARLELARQHWEQISKALRRGDAEGIEQALARLVDVAALQPEAKHYVNLAKHLRQLDERYGGCLWLSEASFAAQAFDSSFQSSVDLSQGRIVPSHAALDCNTRPSLLTCFPEHFVPGVGDNCW